VTADHGESFFEHKTYVGHGLFLNDNEIRIPLVVKLPANKHAGERIQEPVGLIDVAPSILDALGVPLSEGFQGKSLLSPRPGAPEACPEIIYGHADHTGATFVRTATTKFISSWRKKPSKVIANHLRPRKDSPLLAQVSSGEQFFDLATDPLETRNRIDSPAHAELLATMRSLAASHDAASRERRTRVQHGTTTIELPPETVKRLQALGYLGDNE
jgi:arylsulfatase A-like enzyme